MEPRISFVTLGVADLDREARFYRDTLGLPLLKQTGEIALFELGTTWLALYRGDDLAADAGVPADGTGFRRFALAHNVRSKEEVDALLAHAAAGGGSLIRPAEEKGWGGYSGYFADPEGFLWEVAWNPRFPHV